MIRKSKKAVKLKQRRQRAYAAMAGTLRENAKARYEAGGYRCPGSSNGRKVGR